jgi:hypothetical protein
LESIMESPVGSSGSFCTVTGSLLVEGLGVLEELDALEAGSWNGSLKGLSPDPWRAWAQILEEDPIVDLAGLSMG